MLSLTNDQQMILDSVEQLANEEFRDKAYTWGSEIPWENIELLADHGYMGINFEEKWGGGGMSEFEVMLIVEILGKICPDTANFYHANHLIGPRAIEMFGSEAAKKKYIPPIVEGNDSIAVAISEPEAGSDVQSMNTTVREENGELILNGEKTWVSAVDYSSAAVVWVKFPEGLGSIVVDLDEPNLKISGNYTNMAGHKQAQFVMEDIVVPEENVLTRDRNAFKQQLKSLNWERLGAAMKSNAWAMSAFNMALDYAQNRQQFDQAIGDFQGNEWKIADMAKRIEASRMLTYSAAQTALDQGRVPDRLETAIAKLHSTETVLHVVDESLQLHGANGYMKEHPLEYLYRLARGRRFGAGTDEIIRNNIASVVKENGLPSHW
ncbi:acyl-CoA dehydrogenase family protein [Natrinema halophilum]|uniref:acyl-CoA dehydrogenase family protein n=1 Tax=Natrinema halophilum TaxID=1699371 RepID=UPI001F17644E|nr:acyl-CoA dehydrogenase family protein [Natrinema halophilum]UHQ96214.1 acyl-CoA dehydrogenase family protein [Natrinema halophilum]